MKTGTEVSLAVLSIEMEKDLLVLCVSEIIFEFVENNVYIVAKEIASIIRKFSSEDENLLIDKINDALIKHRIENSGLASIIVKSAKSLI